MTPRSETMALVLAYDGTDYAGWQVQPNAPTIQGEVEAALARVHGVNPGELRVAGSGRTDAGVHALGQVASYRPPSTRAPHVLETALLDLLPPAVRVLAARSMPEDFHARRSATGKIYRYRIVNRRVMLPFEARYAWHVTRRLDIDAMRDAARSLVGRHDFAAFASTGGQAESTTRDIRRLDVRLCGGGIVEIEAEADGFLYHMVRNITGLLVDIGTGRRLPAESARILASRRRDALSVGAPPQGLCLQRVVYDHAPGFEAWPLPMLESPRAMQRERLP